MEHSPDASLGSVQLPDAKEDPSSGEDSKDQAGDGNKLARSNSALVSVDTEEGPSDRNGTSEITFG